MNEAGRCDDAPRTLASTTRKEAVVAADTSGEHSLADQVESLAQQLAAVRTEVASLARMADEVSRLADRVAELAALRSAGTGATAPMSWFNLNAEQATADLVELTRWVYSVLLHYSVVSQQLTDCWRRHPSAVEGLLALRAAWYAAYRRPGARPETAVDWHIRLLPGVADLLRAGRSNGTAAAVPGCCRTRSMCAGTPCGGPPPGESVQTRRCPDPQRPESPGTPLAKLLASGGPGFRLATLDVPIGRGRCASGALPLGLAHDLHDLPGTLKLGGDLIEVGCIAARPAWRFRLGGLGGEPGFARGGSGLARLGGPGVTGLQPAADGVEPAGHFGVHQGALGKLPPPLRIGLRVRLRVERGRLFA